METIKAVFTQAKYTGLFWLVLRLFVGYEFFSAGWDKVTSGSWIGQNAIGGFMKGALTKAATGDHPEVQGWYVDLINNVFLPNAVLFSTLVALGEVLVGVALIFGIFTKFAAGSGALMNLAFLAAGTSSSNPQMLAMQVAMVFGGLGVAYYGIDRFLMPFLARTLRFGQAARQTTALQTPRPVS